MPSLFENLSAAERKDIANKILDLPLDQQREFASQLGSVIEKISAQEAEKTRKKTVMSKISAARSDPHLGGKNELGLIDGSLHRAGLEPLDSLAVKPPHEIHSILASANKLASRDRFAVKSFLFKIGAIPA
jgi:hypothetical protein